MSCEPRNAFLGTSFSEHGYFLARNLLTGAVHLSHSVDRTLKVFRSSKYSLLNLVFGPPPSQGSEKLAPSTAFRGSSRGFSFVEMILVIAISGILATVVFGAFSTAVSREALTKKTALVLSLLEKARADTLSGKGGSAYGVHFETTKAVLFAGTTYVSSNASNISEPLNQVQISAITLAGGGSDVVFNRLTGETVQSGTVTLSLVASSTQTKVITISATGVASGN